MDNYYHNNTQYNKKYNSLIALNGGSKVIENVNNIVRWTDALSASKENNSEEVMKYLETLQFILEPSKDKFFKSEDEINALIEGLKTRIEKVVPDPTGKNISNPNESTSLFVANTFGLNDTYVQIDFNKILQMYSDFIQKDKMFQLMINENKNNKEEIPRLLKLLTSRTEVLAQKSEDFKKTVSKLQSRIIELKLNEFPIYLTSNIIWDNSSTDISSNGNEFTPKTEIEERINAIDYYIHEIDVKIMSKGALQDMYDDENVKLVAAKEALKNIPSSDELNVLQIDTNEIKRELENINNIVTKEAKFIENVKFKLGKLIRPLTVFGPPEIKSTKKLESVKDAAKKTFSSGDMGLGGTGVQYIQEEFINNRDKIYKGEGNELYAAYYDERIKGLIEANIETLSIENYRSLVESILKEYEGYIESLNGGFSDVYVDMYTEYAQALNSAEKTGNTAKLRKYRNDVNYTQILPRIIIQHLYSKRIKSVLLFLNNSKRYSEVDKIIDDFKEIPKYKQKITEILGNDNDQNKLGLFYDTNFTNINGDIEKNQLVDYEYIDLSVENMDKLQIYIQEKLDHWDQHDESIVVMEQLTDAGDIDILNNKKEKLEADRVIMEGKLKNIPTVEQIILNINGSLGMLKNKLEKIENEVKVTFKDIETDASDISSVLKDVNNLGNINAMAGGEIPVNSPEELKAEITEQSVNKSNILSNLQKFAIESDLLKKNMYQIYSLATEYIKLNKKMCIYYIYQFIAIKQTLKKESNSVIPNKFMSVDDLKEMLSNCKNMKDKITNKITTSDVVFFSNLHKYTIERSIYLLETIIPLFSVDKDKIYINIQKNSGLISDDLKTANHISVLIKKAELQQLNVP